MHGKELENSVRKRAESKKKKRRETIKEITCSNTSFVT